MRGTRTFNMAHQGANFEVDEILEKERRKAIFRDIGREILSTPDGDNAVKIMRAMERAFQAGITITRDEKKYAAAAKIQSKQRRLEKIDLPPRSRGVLEMIGTDVEYNLPVALAYSNDRYLGETWTLFTIGGKNPQSWKPSSLTALIKHKLLIEMIAPTGQRVLVLSTKGLELIRTGAVAFDAPATSTVEFENPLKSTS